MRADFKAKKTREVGERGLNTHLRVWQGGHAAGRHQLRSYRSWGQTPCEGGSVCQHREGAVRPEPVFPVTPQPPVSSGAE